MHERPADAKRMRYIGPIAYLNGKTALVASRSSAIHKQLGANANSVLVQFDDLRLGSWSQRWHAFSPDDFNEAEE